MKSRYLNLLLVIIMQTACLCAWSQENVVNYVTEDVMINAGATNPIHTIQYYDGLGRPTLNATNGSNTSGKYVYSLSSYDNCGRKSKQFLPVYDQTLPILFSESQISSSANSQYADSRAFSEIEYDAIGRVVNTTTPGQSWIGKGVSVEYLTNTSNSVKYYSVDNVPLMSPNRILGITPNPDHPIGGGNQFNPEYVERLVEHGYYPEGALSSKKTTDEDGHSIEVFSDILGNIVLERRDSNNDTYYVYSGSLLKYVVPPMYQEECDTSFLYKYNYDRYGRCVEKMLPGCQPIRYWYDKYGRVAFMQDGRMRSNSCYRFYLYEPLGRVAIQGICSGGNMNENNPATVSFNQGSSGLLGTGYVLGNGVSILAPSIEKVNYYDGYNFLNTELLSSICQTATFQCNTTSCTTTLLTGQILTATNGNRLIDVIYYDDKGRVTHTRSQNIDGYKYTVTNTYSFTDKPKTSAKILSKSGSNLYTAYSIYNYSQKSDKLDNIVLMINGSNQTKIVQNTYDNLGRLSSCKTGNLHVNNQYSYDLHGWLRAVSSTNILQGNRMLWHESLYYADGYGTYCYNGNISSLSYYPDVNNLTSRVGYKFYYDGLNRLSRSEYGQGTNLQKTRTDFSERAVYNQNGSIDTLYRYGKTNYGYGIIDKLIYKYQGNQLESVRDSAVSLAYTNSFDFKDGILHLSKEYFFDECGALITDVNKKITLIDYDYNGLPVRVQFSNGNVTENIYDTNGNKLKTIYRKAVPNILVKNGKRKILTEAETMSVDSISYIVDFEFENGPLTGKYYFDSGYASLLSGAVTYHTYVYDHLGNIRKVVNQDGTVEEQTNYFPYGGVMNDISTSGGVQLKKYHGKRLDRIHGLDWYDYGARYYDAALAMFTTMDPMAEKYYHISPYAYCLGNPVRFIDPDGREPTIEEAALMAAHVYGDISVTLKGGWRVSKNTFGISLCNSSNGFKSQLYERELNGELEYVYATAGTDVFDIKDWKNNVSQLIGLSDQYSESANNAVFLAEKLKNNELNFVGHSMGGGEAALNSLLTSKKNLKGRKAITFNAAGVSIITKIVVGGLDIAFKREDKISAYVLSTDPLNLLQHKIDILPRSNGKIKFLLPKDLMSILNGHSISNVSKCF